jgi:uncharacterized membrane protein YkvA (DUF1232 family)
VGIEPNTVKEPAMSHAEIDPRYLEVFSQWLRSLGEDTAAVGDAVATSGENDEATRSLVAGVNYVFKSLDLIPDGVDDLGFMDDAFVLRVACALAANSRPDVKAGAIERLSTDAGAVHDFLGEDYARLESYVVALRKGGARGRTVDDIVGDARTRTTFLGDLKEWSTAYKPPNFTRDPKTLVKLKAFLSAKLG